LELRKSVPERLSFLSDFSGFFHLFFSPKI
jgi:hypothetical protein